MSFIYFIVLLVFIAGCGWENTFRVTSSDQLEKDIRESFIMDEIYMQICKNKKQVFEFLIGASKEELINTLGKPNKKINARFSIFYKRENLDDVWVYYTKDENYKYRIKFGIKLNQVKKIYVECIFGPGNVAEVF